MGIFKKLKCAFISKPKDLLDTLSDHSTVDQIRAIPLPTIGSEDNKDLKEHSDYILQRKATNYKNIGRMDLAIACLEKANQIMPNSSIAWKDTDYLRLIDYLKLDGQFEKASKEEEKLRKNLPEIFSIIVARSSAFNKVLKDCGEFGTDLVEASSHSPTCETCSIYQGRIYSISGKDNRFPKLPDSVFQFGGFHEGCRHAFYPFLEKYGAEPIFDGDPIKVSNRPFVDERTKEEKEEYTYKQNELKRKNETKEEYYKLLEKLPDIAPKSLSAYSRMRRLKTESFKLLTEEARKIGILIGEDR